MFSRIIEKTPSRVLNFQYGTTYLEFFIAPIPRSLWPEKPPSLGVQLKRVLVDAKAEGGIPPSMVGELYFNFDMFGIFVGMFLWGAICWHIYKTQVLERGTTPTVFLRYLIFIVYCLMPWVRTNFAIMAIHFSTLIIPYLIATQTINWCCLRRRRTLVANRGVSRLAMQGYQRRQLY
jgi:oligosaccharide repeat unit polymerase